MEDQNRFDLEVALRAWREDCACRPGICPEDARELESDLRERVADLLSRGLSEKAAFREAVRQVGSPGVLAREFARENPVAVWRERLFWMVVAGFAVAVWHLMSGGVIVWTIQSFGVLLPLSGAACGKLASGIPLLLIAALLATGRLEKLTASFPYFMQTRKRLFMAGGCLLFAGVLMRLLGPQRLPLPNGAGLTALFLFDISAWPLLLLALAVFLCRPLSAGGAASLQLHMGSVPTAVWRNRVCWMLAGGLAVGFWDSVSGLCTKALFYTGDIDRPFKPGWLFPSTSLLLQLSPIILLGFMLHQRMRRGKDITGAALVRKRVLLPFVPALVFAWIGLYLWSEYHWLPRGISLSFRALLAYYAVSFQWFWPVGLAVLLLWLAPERSDGHQDVAFS